MTANDIKKQVKHFLLNVLRNYRARYGEDIHIEPVELHVRKGVCMTSLTIKESGATYNITAAEEDGGIGGNVAAAEGKSITFFFVDGVEEDTEASKSFDALIHQDIHREAQPLYKEVDINWRFRNNA